MQRTAASSSIARRNPSSSPSRGLVMRSQAAADAQRAIAGHSMARRRAGQGSDGDPLGRPGGRRRPIRGPGRLARRACLRLCPRRPGAACRPPPARSCPTTIGAGLRNLGSYQLKDFAEPEPIAQLVVDGLPAQFPPLRTEAAPSRRKRADRRGRRRRARRRDRHRCRRRTRGGGDSVAVGPTSVAVIDPASNKVVHAVDLGFKSNLIAAGEGYVWVVDPNGSTLWRIDPHTRETKPTSESPSAPARSRSVSQPVDGAVWVAVLRGTKEVVLEFGPEVGDLRRDHSLRWTSCRARSQSACNPLAVGNGAVWAIDPERGRRLAHRPARRQARDSSPKDSTPCRSRQGAGRSGSRARPGVTKLDPLTGRRARLDGTSALRAFGETASVALGAKAVWFASSSGQTLSKVDPQSLATTQTFPVGEGPSGISSRRGGGVGGEQPRRTPSRASIRSGGNPRMIAVGQTPGGLVAAYGSVWTSPGEPRS